MNITKIPAIALITAILTTTAAAVVVSIPINNTQDEEKWIPICDGIDFQKASSTAPLQKICVLRIDTSNTNLTFYTDGRIKDGYEPNKNETYRGTTVDFLTENNLVAAVNACFYSPFNSTTQVTRGPANVTGLCISEGIVVSPHQDGYPSFMVTSNNVATITVTEENKEYPNIRTAVAGSPIILKDGEVLPQKNKDIHPRTAVGISQDNRYVYLMTIDGRQATYSMGATFEQTAEWLKKFGAYQGLNLDGGGSTTMVTRSKDGKAITRNKPVGQGNTPGTLRNNGNHLGVRLRSE